MWLVQCQSSGTATDSWKNIFCCCLSTTCTKAKDRHTHALQRENNSTHHECFHLGWSPNPQPTSGLWLWIRAAPCDTWPPTAMCSWTVTPSDTRVYPLTSVTCLCKVILSQQSTKQRALSQTLTVFPHATARNQQMGFFAHDLEMFWCSCY